MKAFRVYLRGGRYAAVSAGHVFDAVCAAFSARYVIDPVAGSIAVLSVEVQS